jgi:hypothetical protein
MNSALTVATVSIALVACATACGAHSAVRRGPEDAPSARIDLATPLLNSTTNSSERLKDLQGPNGTVVVFGGNTCPVVVAYEPYFATLSRELATKGIRLLEVNSNYAEQPAEVASHARMLELPFAIYKDVDQRLADAVGATRTSEAVLIDRTGRVVYRGRIDDRIAFGVRQPRAIHTDLLDAVDAMLAGHSVASMPPASGCAISRRPHPAPSKLSYADVRPIIEQHCVPCHQPGQAGPMSLRRYDDVAAWVDTIQDVLTQRRMPPFAASGADPAFGDFTNDRGPTLAERQNILAWIAAGAPRGRVDSELPSSSVDSSPPHEWNIGTPDLVVTMDAAYEIPAVSPPGGIPYQYFLAYENTGEEKWVQAAELRPSAPTVVHHANVMMAYPGVPSTPSAGSTVDYGERYVAFAPGRPPQILPQGIARRLPHGGKLWLQMHYTADGHPRTDKTSLALRFSKATPRRELRTVRAAPSHLEIPPFAKNFELKGSYTVKGSAEIFSYTPHMHLRGKDFRIELVPKRDEAAGPAAPADTLLFVPKYDFEWQHVYWLRAPVRVKKGDVISCTAHYDNSADNRNNPDPSAEVHFGQQTWDEMLNGFIDVAYDAETDSPALIDIRRADAAEYGALAEEGRKWKSRRNDHGD